MCVCAAASRRVVISLNERHNERWRYKDACTNTRRVPSGPSSASVVWNNNARPTIHTHGAHTQQITPTRVPWQSLVTRTHDFHSVRAAIALRARTHITLILIVIYGRTWIWARWRARWLCVFSVRARVSVITHDVGRPSRRADARVLCAADTFVLWCVRGCDSVFAERTRARA